MSRPIRALIVDDEPLARDGVRLLLKDDDEVTVIGECADGAEAVATIEHEKPDLVFLDIQMPGMNGLEVLRRLPPDRLPLIIFITAYDQYAVDAFAAHALDYVLKPIDRNRFAEALARAKRRLREKDVNELSARLLDLIKDAPTAAPGRDVPSDRLDRITIKEANRIYFVAVADIDYIEAADYYVRLHTGRKSHLLRMSLSALAERLDPHTFVRIHRSTIVNVTRIRELQPHFQGEYHVLLHDGTRLKLSRGYRDRLDKILGGSS